VMERQLRELLNAEAGDPPHRVTVEAVRRRAVRRWVMQAGAAGLAVVLAVGLGVALSNGVLHIGASPASSSQPAGPPRFYILQGGQVLQVRNTHSGRVTATIHDPLPGSTCGGGNVGVAAADNQTFFMTCVTWKTTRAPGRPFKRTPGHPIRPAKITSIQTHIYRFQVTDSGRITGYSRVKGGVLKGWASNIAAAPDGSEIAAEVFQPTAGKLYTNAVPEGIVVINTRTGSQVLWRSGPYVPGAVQFGNGTDMSFTRDGRELAVLEAWCHRGPHKVFCNGHADMQLRAYSTAARGGSLESGQVLLNESALKPPGTSLVDGFITPDGSSVTALLATCPRHGACTLSVAGVQLVTGRALRVLYQTHTGSQYQGFFERFFSWDPSGRFLILDAGQGNARVNGWIDRGRLVPLTPADGNAPVYETW
jgi:hypothetical protein